MSELFRRRTRLPPLAVQALHSNYIQDPSYLEFPKSNHCHSKIPYQPHESLVRSHNFATLITNLSAPSMEVQAIAVGQLVFQSEIWFLLMNQQIGATLTTLKQHRRRFRPPCETSRSADFNSVPGSVTSLDSCWISTITPLAFLSRLHRTFLFNSIPSVRNPSSLPTNHHARPMFSSAKLLCNSRTNNQIASCKPFLLEG